MEDKKWIVMTGQPIDTIKGGGFEFFGPYTEDDAKEVQKRFLELKNPYPGSQICIALQLLTYEILRKGDKS